MKHIQLLLYCALLLTGATSHAQTITTVVGGTTPSTTIAPAEGVTATAVATWVSMPTGIVFDNIGNMFIADLADDMIRKVDVAHNITNVAGNWYPFSPLGAADSGDGFSALATTCKLIDPTDVGVDNAGNIYVAEAADFLGPTGVRGGRVRMIDHITGIITTIAGGGSRPTFPNGDGGPATAAEIEGIMGIAVDPTGSPIYVSDNNFNRVRVITRSGSSYVINGYAGSGPAGTAPYGDGGPATNANLSNPRGIFVYNGDLYIADEFHSIVRKVDHITGIITTVAGSTTGFSGDGGLATAAQLNNPYDVQVDAVGNIYIADFGNKRVRYVNSATGKISTIAGNNVASASPYGDGGPATAAYLGSVSSVLLDGTGSYYLSDQTHNTIRYVHVPPNNPPLFTGGTTQNLSPVCENATAISLNSLLAVNDADAGNTETWSVLTPPAYGGILTTAYTTTSTGSTITPVGLSYTPPVGFSGTDHFTIQVSDGTVIAATTIYVTVNPSPAVAPITPASSSVCIGGSVVLTDITTGGSWVASNANANVVNGTVTGAVAGSAVIYYIKSNSCGTDSALATITINTVAPASVSISSSLGTSTCGLPGTFTALPVNGGSAPAYQWSLVSGPIPGATNSVYSYAPAPGDVLTVELTSSATCATPLLATASITFTAVAILPAISITPAHSDTVCPGYPVTFTASITNGGTSPVFNWMVNGASMGSGNTFVYTPGTGSEGDIIKCALTSNAPCASPVTVTSNLVTIHLRSAGSASLLITAHPGDIVCAGTPVTFTTTETGGGSTPFFRWKKAGISVATGPTYTVIPNNGDAVFCEMHSSIACSASDTTVSNTIGITVGTTLPPTVVVTAVKTSAGVGETVMFTATVSGTGAPFAYQWYVNGNAIPGATSSTYNFTGRTNGADIIDCAVTSVNTCTPAATSNFVTINVSGEAVQLVSASNAELKIVPNPNKGTFSMNLLADNIEQVHVSVTNLFGEKVADFTTFTNTATDISIDKAAGIYFLTVTTPYEIYTAKVIVN